MEEANPVKGKASPPPGVPVNVVLIHGVGPFDERKTVADVRALLVAADVFPKTIQPVNWRHIAGDLSGEEDQFLGQIAAISRGVQGTVHLEKANRGVALRWVRNWSLVLPLLLPCLLFLPFRAWVWQAAGLVFVTSAALHMLLAMTAGGRTPLTALVSSVLPWLWLAGHACLMLPYLIIRLLVGTIGCWAGFVILVILVPASFFVFRIGCLSIFLPPIVYFLLSHAVHQTTFSFFLPAWRRFVERSGAALLLLAADVIRYLGDSEYRVRIQSEVVEKIRQSNRRERLVIVAHSLGSVIAVDTLLKMKKEGNRDVTLITMGSPLLRLMHRLLPKEYPSPQDARALLVEEGLLRRWINIYRPLDMVGARLFQGAPGDYSTGEWIKGWLPPLHAHLNYWGDRKVLDNILAGLRDETEGAGGQPVQRVPLINGPVPANSQWFQALADSLGLLLCVIVYARLIVRLVTLPDEFPSCIAFLGAGLFLLVTIPFILRVLLPYTLSLSGARDGGASWVPAINKARKDFEETVLP